MSVVPKFVSRISLLMFLAAAAYAQVPPLTGDVETSVDRSFDPAPKDCADVRWSEAARTAFPNIGSACQSVEQRNGKTYVKFEGTVEEVARQGKRIVVDFEDGQELTFSPSPQTVLYLDGKRTSFTEVREGTKLDFYVPEDRLQAELRPDPTRVAFIIFPLDVSPAVAATEQNRARTAEADRRERRDAATAANELPRTAGPLPLFGATGAALLLIAAAMAIRRQRKL